jgi:SAM-dependent methyltransferase
MLPYFNVITRKKLTPARALRYLKARLPQRIHGSGAYKDALSGKTALEIGGPSETFGDRGALPIYRCLKTVDNCLYSARTIWTGELAYTRRFIYHPSKSPGVQFIADAVNLAPIENCQYDCILSSHCLEHVANPLLALSEWKRVLKTEGLLVLVLPHKDGTFDWRRPSTTLAHLIEDYRAHITEDDLTHVPEVLELHDLRRDKPAGALQEFRLRCLNNHAIRAMHHHVFDTHTSLSMVDHAGLHVMRVDHLKPCHIFVLAEHRQSAFNNTAFLAPDAEWRRHSLFPSDRIPN